MLSVAAPTEYSLIALMNEHHKVVHFEWNYPNLFHLWVGFIYDKMCKVCSFTWAMF